MIDNLKKILNEDQDPKAIEKITSKLANLLMSNEEVGYIAVQKKPAVTILPDSIVVTNKRIILCKPKNLGLSMEFMDYDWDDIAGAFVKEGILGADFTFTTQSELTHTVDYLPKNQARKLYTYAKEQMDLLKNPKALSTAVDDNVEEFVAEEVTHFAELMTTNNAIQDTEIEASISEEKGLAHLSQDELFAKLQNYKKLLDNGLILQGEYDRLKAEILKFL
ncbi:PH domain-containing protein [Flavobacterium sp.]|jgi:hypothetical protein|uniref:PH domain-containing protein n=1 Tax=Flavobacterium sp. TaxID=239 RepID=UPI0037C13B1E